MEVCEDWQSGKGFEETNLHMLDNELGSDITLVVGTDGQTIQAHKFILASRSMVFYSMFYGHLAEKGFTINIPDIPFHVMKVFLRFLYTAHVSLDPENVMALMYCAKKYSVQTLVQACRKYLQTEINASNVCTIMEQAHVFDEKDLWEHCLATVFSNSVEVLTCEFQDYTNLCHDCMRTIFKDERLMAMEDMIYRACKCWAEEKCMQKNLEVTDENVRLMLGEILYLIRFPLMSERAFTELVSSGNVLTAEEKLEVYQSFNSEPSDSDNALKLKAKFPSQERVSTLVHKLERFKETVGGIIDYWLNDNLYDAISFKCSRSVNLVGVTVFSPFPDGVIRGSLCFFDETYTCIAKLERLEISHCESKNAEIKLNKPVKIEDNKWYTVRQQMTGAKSYFGVKGQKEIVGKGAVFAFRNSPMDTNNTNVETGQVSGLLYM